MIEVQNANVYFNRGTSLELRVINNLDFRMRTGEWAMLIGSNGAGKSTLLNVLAGNVPLDDGIVKIDGDDVTNEPTHIRSAHVARVFQDPALGTCADLSIEENLALALDRGKRRGFGSAIHHQTRDMFRSLLRDLNLNLENRLKEPMSSLSGGQRQAVGLIMATMRPAKLLLLDEHTAALDPQMTEVVMQLTERVVRQNKLTTIMITHNMRHASIYGDRCVVMHHGRIVKDLAGADRADAHSLIPD